MTNQKNFLKTSRTVRQSSLRRALALTRSRAFFDMSDRKIPKSKIADFVILEGISTLIIEQHRVSNVEDIQKSPLFDELLLKYSIHYRRTRMLAKATGIELVPELASLERSMADFNPFSNRVIYSPIASELEWVLGLKDFKVKLAHYVSLFRFLSSTYHDLNQTIIAHRIYSEKLTTRAQQSKFYWFVEALTIMRDLQIAEELEEIAIPLKNCSVLYSALGPRRYTPVLDSYESFRSALLTFYFQLNGWLLRDIELFFDSRNWPWLFHPGLKVVPSFATEISPAWASRQEVRNFSSGQFGEVEITQFLKDERVFGSNPCLVSVYRWYCRKFCRGGS